MTKTTTDAAWAAEHQQRARADRLADMVETRDKRIAKATADAAKLRAEAAKLRARADRLWAMVARRDHEIIDYDTEQDTLQATIKQLRADLAARDNTLRVEVAARDKRIVAQRDEMDARGKRITDLIISFNGEVAAVAERDATIDTLRADAAKRDDLATFDLDELSDRVTYADDAMIVVIRKDRTPKIMTFIPGPDSHQSTEPSAEYLAATYALTDAAYRLGAHVSATGSSFPVSPDA